MTERTIAEVSAELDVMERERKARIDMKLNEAKSATRTMIYFIECPETNSVKIGIACDPEHRLASLQVGCPSHLALIAAAWGGIAEERKLHRVFSEYRIRGEWFRLEGELETFVLNLMAVTEREKTIISLAPTADQLRAQRKQLLDDIQAEVDKMKAAEDARTRAA